MLPAEEKQEDVLQLVVSHGKQPGDQVSVHLMKKTTREHTVHLTCSL